MYKILFDLSVDLLKQIARGLGCDSTELLSLISPNDPDQPAPQNNIKSNFCLFRYNDDKKVYTTTQKCMVHQDSGLITLLPRSTFPGLEVLDKNNKIWIPVEKFTQKNDVLVFAGLVMQKITNGVFQAATHRVVREPGMERFSMPFDVKPNRNVKLHPINCKLVQQKSTFEPTTLDMYPIHLAICDRCGKYISGVRFKCNDCKDYDHCETCNKANDTKPFHLNHSFKSINKPLGLMEDKEVMIAAEFDERISAKKQAQKVYRISSAS